MYRGYRRVGRTPERGVARSVAAITPVQRHVDQQAQPDQMEPARDGPQAGSARLAGEHEREHEDSGIQCDGGRGVQRVESDRAARRVVNRIREQVIEIDEQRRDHQQRSHTPAGAVDRQRDRDGDDEVKCNVKHCPNDTAGWVVRLLPAGERISQHARLKPLERTRESTVRDFRQPVTDLGMAGGCSPTA